MFQAHSEEASPSQHVWDLGKRISLITFVYTGKPSQRLCVSTGGRHWRRAHRCLRRGGRPRFGTPGVILRNGQLIYLTCSPVRSLRRLWVPGNPEGGGAGEHQQPQPQHHLDRPWRVSPGNIHPYLCPITRRSQKAGRLYLPPISCSWCPTGRRPSASTFPLLRSVWWMLRMWAAAT